MVDGKDSRRWLSLGTFGQGGGGVQDSQQVSHCLWIAFWVASHMCDEKYCKWQAPVQTQDLGEVTLVVTHTFTGEKNKKELL